jgi:hypothetical protein
MSLGPEAALEACVVARLKADAGVSALVGGRVYDRAPERPTAPYLTVGRSETRPYAGTDDAVEQALTLTCVSRYGGPDEARAVVSAARAALHDARPAPADGWRAANLRVTYSDVFTGRMPLTTVGTLRLRAVMEAA